MFDYDMYTVKQGKFSLKCLFLGHDWELRACYPYPRAVEYATTYYACCKCLHCGMMRSTFYEHCTSPPSQDMLNKRFKPRKKKAP